MAYDARLTGSAATPDYEGVSMTQRDAAQKAAAKEATNIFQNHYPEFLVRAIHLLNV